MDHCQLNGFFHLEVNREEAFRDIVQETGLRFRKEIDWT